MTKRPCLLLVLLSACAAPAALPDLPPGKGVTAFDSTPPPGAELFERPTWRVGDRFTLLRGGRQRLEQHVVAATGQGYELRDQNGGRLFRDLDLAILGEAPADAEMQHRFVPRDVRFLWPLWVGKSWQCHYVEQTADAAVPVEVRYVVEDVDTVAVGGGTFRCLRIRSTTQRADEDAGGYYEGTRIIWFAPEPGLEVRQILGGLAIDLVEWSQPRP